MNASRHPHRAEPTPPPSATKATTGEVRLPTPTVQPMRAHESIEENLRFLIIEVEKQLRRTGAYLQRPTKASLAKIVAGDDYIDNLKTIIQGKSFNAAADARQAGKESVALLRTFEVIANNLERIADFCERIIVQVGYVERRQLLAEHDFRAYLDEVLAGVRLIDRAVFKRDVQVALGICRTEHTLDRMYGKSFKRVLSALRADDGDGAQSLVTVLFIAHYLERMGDALLNIGEALLTAHLGERIKIGQLRTLEDSLEATELDGHLGHLSMKAMGETKSGARVASLSMSPSSVEPDDGPRPRSVIFKEGKTRKLVEERDSIARWERLMPGLAPKIYSFHDGGEDGAILFEYLPGATFESMLLQKPWPDVRRSLDFIQQKIVSIWQHTRKDVAVAPRFLEQLSNRFDDVLSVHSEFRDSDARIGAQKVASFSSLVDRLEAYDRALQAPFSVFIHGDFNVDNVIYDRQTDEVRYIDLHRSRMMDYVQDVSVFLVSHFRLQYLGSPVRRRINAVILQFHEFAREQADRMGDATFDQRLALGVARSMATSTRFVLDRHLARTMFLRSRYILERALEHYESGAAENFRLPREVLID